MGSNGLSSGVETGSRGSSSVEAPMFSRLKKSLIEVWPATVLVVETLFFLVVFAVLLEAFGFFRKKPLISFLSSIFFPTTGRDEGRKNKKGDEKVGLRMRGRPTSRRVILDGSDSESEPSVADERSNGSSANILPLCMRVLDHKVEDDTGYYEVALSRGLQGEVLYSVWKRYSEFRELHLAFGGAFPDFPGKTLFPLRRRTMDERRMLLEKFLQQLDFGNSLSHLNPFFGFYGEFELSSGDVRGNDINKRRRASPEGEERGFVQDLTPAGIAKQELLSTKQLPKIVEDRLRKIQDVYPRLLKDVDSWILEKSGADTQIYSQKTDRGMRRWRVSQKIRASLDIVRRNAFLLDKRKVWDPNVEPQSSELIAFEEDATLCGRVDVSEVLTSRQGPVKSRQIVTATLTKGAGHDDEDEAEGEGGGSVAGRGSVGGGAVSSGGASRPMLLNEENKNNADRNAQAANGGSKKSSKTSVASNGGKLEQFGAGFPDCSFKSSLESMVVIDDGEFYTCLTRRDAYVHLEALSLVNMQIFPQFVVDQAMAGGLFASYSALLRQCEEEEGGQG
ncbi:unnamed protein product [Amoebophrya sp. A25]|nr:unnamed protein product [Amoebophrya sp. A25]|eukprot:GSA25T00021132001.1